MTSGNPIKLESVAVEKVDKSGYAEIAVNDRSTLHHSEVSEVLFERMPQETKFVTIKDILDGTAPDTVNLTAAVKMKISENAPSM